VSQQPHAQSQPKKKHTARNIIVVILGVFVLVGGFANFFGGKSSK
jgi:flagellar basal body-associated protein FliL